VNVHLVRVTIDRTWQLWAAATPRDEAIDRVLSAAPEGCTAHMLDERLKPRPDIVDSMNYGEVRQISYGQRPRST